MLSYYYFLQDNHNVSPGTFPGFSSGAQGRAQLATFGDTKTFGANKVNEFRISFMRYVAANFSTSNASGVTLASLGFATGTNTSGLVVQRPDLEGVPPISMQNFSFGVPAEPGGGTYNGNYQLTDNFSWVKGRAHHQVRRFYPLRSDLSYRCRLPQWLFQFQQRCRVGKRLGGLPDRSSQQFYAGFAVAYLHTSALPRTLCAGQLAHESRPDCEFRPALGRDPAMV